MSAGVRSRLAVGAAIALGAVAALGTADAQAPAARTAPAVGDVAPAFSGRGATRYGRIVDPIQVSDYKGKTIVLAFFYRARSSG